MNKSSDRVSTRGTSLVLLETFCISSPWNSADDICGLIDLSSVPTLVSGVVVTSRSDFLRCRVALFIMMRRSKKSKGQLRTESLVLGW